jgi:hypothetical protein
MIAASSGALSSAWKWLNGWQQHERLVAQGQSRALKPRSAKVHKTSRRSGRAKGSRTLGGKTAATTADRDRAESAAA